MANITRRIRWLLTLALLTASLETQATRFFWGIRYTPDLKMLVHGLARVSLPKEKAGTVAAEMQLFSLGKNKGPSPTSVVPATAKNWSIRSLMKMDWQKQPQVALQMHSYNGSTSDASGSVHSRGRSIISQFDAEEQPRVPAEFEVDFRPLPLRQHFNATGDWVIPYFFGYPGRIRGGFTRYRSPWFKRGGIEISSLPEIAESPAVKQILQSLNPVERMNISNDSPLVQAITAVATGETGAIFQGEIGEFLAHLGGEPSAEPIKNMYFSPEYEMYLKLAASEGGTQGIALVSHEAMVKQGLIPGAESSNPQHMNPEQWGDFTEETVD